MQGFVVILQGTPSLSPSYLRHHKPPSIIPFIPPTEQSRFGRPALDALQKDLGITSGKVVLREQYSLDIPLTLIRSMTGVGDTVISIFAGVGTDAVAGMMLGRNVLSIEKEPAYFAALRTRVNESRGALIDSRKWSRRYYTQLNRAIAEYRENKISKGEPVPPDLPDYYPDEEIPDEQPTTFDRALGTLVPAEDPGVLAEKQELLEQVKGLGSFKDAISKIPRVEDELNKHVTALPTVSVKELKKLVAMSLEFNFDGMAAMGSLLTMMVQRAQATPAVEGNDGEANAEAPMAHVEPEASQQEGHGSDEDFPVTEGPLGPQADEE